MSRREEHRLALAMLAPTGWPGYLTGNSGLPGPRTNLELAEAAADLGDAALFDALIATDDEYLVLCGVIGLGRLVADRMDLADRLRAHASDQRWRVREGVAMALQRIGDADPAGWRKLLDAWAADPDPLVQRAAIAGACEPRLLGTPERGAWAVQLCQRVTDSLTARPVTERRTDGVRVLRQALGYCWSIAVAADPASGLPHFRELELRWDPDVQWVVRENRRRSRLARLL